MSIKCRSDNGHVFALVGRKRGGRSKGRRVVIEGANAHGQPFQLSVYPEDARKFAMELLHVADIAEKE